MFNLNVEVIYLPKATNPNALCDALEQGTPFSAGYDLRANIAEPIKLTNVPIMIPTGIKLNMLKSAKPIVGIVAPRSGLGIKHQVKLANTIGVIDMDYQGEIMLGMYCSSLDGYMLNPNERVAQIVFTSYEPVNLHSVDEFDSISERGEGGFGHTGKQ